MNKATIVVALLLWAGSAHAVDHFLFGKKLLIKNPASGTSNNKLVFVATGPVGIPAGVAEDPRCAPLGSEVAYLKVNSAATAQGFTIDLGGASCGNWSANGAGDRYVYRDPSGTTCKIVVVKDGVLLKAFCKGSQVAYDLGADQVSVSVILGIGTNTRRYCATFRAGLSCNIRKNGSDDRTYLSKRCNDAEGFCVSPSGAFLDGGAVLF